MRNLTHSKNSKPGGCSCVNMHSSLKLETENRMKFKFPFTLVRIAGEINDDVSGADTDFTFKCFLATGGVPL